MLPNIKRAIGIGAKSLALKLSKSTYRVTHILPEVVDNLRVISVAKPAIGSNLLQGVNVIVQEAKELLGVVASRLIDTSGGKINRSIGKTLLEKCLFNCTPYGILGKDVIGSAFPLKLAVVTILEKIFAKISGLTCCS